MKPFLFLWAKSYLTSIYVTDKGCILSVENYLWVLCAAFTFNIKEEKWDSWKFLKSGILSSQVIVILLTYKFDLNKKFWDILYILYSSLLSIFQKINRIYSIIINSKFSYNSICFIKKYSYINHLEFYSAI